MAVLNEIQAAHWAGFARWRDFRLALRRGLFPPPDRELPDGPRWDTETLTRWLRRQQQQQQVKNSIDEQELAERALKLARDGDVPRDNRVHSGNRRTTR